MLTRELITRAYYLSNLVSRDIETVDQGMISDGLVILNSLLGEKSARGAYIPYYNHVDIPSVAGQREYVVPGLIILSTLTFNIENVVYPMTLDTRYQYWGTGRIQNINSLPTSYYHERQLNGTRFFVYFAPSADIDFFTVTGRFALLKVGLDDELNDIIDDFYQNYLRYLLAKRICNEYTLTFPPQKEQVLQELEQNCADVTPLDLSYRKISTLGERSGYSWGDINIGRGWRP